ncbi:MAG: glycosyltransferase family 2 protein [Leptolyngbya sp. SIO4C1]|nr:glycosyltransferase family 2 protein [Leptolyngbya sp. SIO4C1]
MTDHPSSSTTRLAVLMSCYNRRDTTLSCLKSLTAQASPNIRIKVYLVDDGSTDGTAAAVSADYPETTILQGNGALFWVGGMRLAFAAAMQAGHDHYLWLNDDTILEPDAIATLIATHRALQAQGQSDAIVVGSVKDATSGLLTYGGRVRSTRHFYHKFQAVEPGDSPKQCDTMQGNCVLIPQSVAEKVGNIDDVFIHTMGDLDYGLRAGQLGCSVWLAPGYLGTCSQNSVRGSWVDTQTSVFERLQKVTQPKAFPLKAWTVFARRYKGRLWFLYWGLPYLRAVVGYRQLSASPTFRADSYRASSHADS